MTLTWENIEDEFQHHPTARWRHGEQGQLAGRQVQDHRILDVYLVIVEVFFRYNALCIEASNWRGLYCVLLWLFMKTGSEKKKKEWKKNVHEERKEEKKT